MYYKQQSLPADLLRIIRDKDTEFAFTGEYENLDKSGTYLCRQCGIALFHSETKFHSGCGWPSFDQEIPERVLYETDQDGRRTEILCKRCNAHLGHVFKDEGFTALNTRHCVNSASLDFVADKNVQDTEEAIYAGGCFWGVEYYIQKLEGVLKVVSGYSGGTLEKPTYEDICYGNTGHYEVVRVVYDKAKLTYKDLTKYFFEIHDPTQKNGQGPDIGHQYQSVCFYYSEEQKKIATELIGILQERNYQIATQILPVSTFWQAEDYHQNYYATPSKSPYCHHYEKRF